MRPFLQISILLISSLRIYAFWIPLSVEEKVAQSDFVGVIEIEKVDEESGVCIALVIESLKGDTKLDKLDISTFKMRDENGEDVYFLAGADPNLKKNKRYLIYLRIIEDGTYQVVQSESDALEIKKGLGGSSVEDEKGNKRIYLEAKLSALRKIILNQNKTAERNAE